MGISSKLLLDASGTQASELDSICSLSDRGTVYSSKIHLLLFICICGMLQALDVLCFLHQTFYLGTEVANKSFY